MLHLDWAASLSAQLGQKTLVNFPVKVFVFHYQFNPECLSQCTILSNPGAAEHAACAGKVLPVLGYYLCWDVICAEMLPVLGCYLCWDVTCARTLPVLGCYLCWDAACAGLLPVLGCYLRWGAVCGVRDAAQLPPSPPPTISSTVPLCMPLHKGTRIQPPSLSTFPLSPFPHSVTNQ